MFSADNLPSSGPAPHLPVDLGGNNGPLPPAAACGEPVADDGFCLARLAAVAVGGVEEIDARLVGDVHDGVRVFLRRSGPEVHRAKTKSGNFEAGTAEIGEVHSGSLSPPRSGGMAVPGVASLFFPPTWCASPLPGIARCCRLSALLRMLSMPNLAMLAPVAAGGELALGLLPERGAAHHLGELLREVCLRLQH
jgi:hypothetical protein